MLTTALTLLLLLWENYVTFIKHVTMIVVPPLSLSLYVCVVFTFVYYHPIRHW